MEGKKILLGLTTTPGSDWRAKIREIKKFGIAEIALFPTFLEMEQRKELYRLLEEVGMKSIPHVHLRNDMESWELDYFREQFGARVFNVHSGPEDYRFIGRNDKHRGMIFVENQFTFGEKKYFNVETFDQHGICGVCLDLSHLEIDRLLYPEAFAMTEEVLERCFIGCNHVSGVKNKFFARLLGGGEGIARHRIGSDSELAYLRNFSPRYFSSYISLELENPFEEQLKYKVYLEGILDTALII